MGSLKYSVGSLERVPRVSRIVVYTSSGGPRCAMLKEW